MLEWKDLERIFENSAYRHEKLHQKFKSFAECICSTVNQPTYFAKQIACRFDNERNTLIVDFLGKTVEFRFYSFLSEGDVHVGQITGFLIENKQAGREIYIGSFEFNANGITELKKSDDNEVYIDDYSDAQWIMLNYLRISAKIRTP